MTALAVDYKRARDESENVIQLEKKWIMLALESGATVSNPTTNVKSVRKSVKLVSDGFRNLVSLSPIYLNESLAETLIKVMNVPPQHGIRGMALIYSALPHMSDGFSDASCPISHVEIGDFFKTIGQNFSPRMILTCLQKYSQCVPTLFQFDTSQSTFFVGRLRLVQKIPARSSISLV
jgi:hypothetical protein